MKNLKMVDITLRESARNPEFSLSFKEKLEVAKQLERLNLDVIELAPIADEKADTLFIHTVALLLKNSVLSCQTGLSAESVEKTWTAVSVAKKPRLHISAPVSSVKMEYDCHKKPDAMLKLIADTVSKARELTPDVEFSAEDATRADKEYLYKAIRTAIEAGARIINISDTAGMMLPNEFADFIAQVKENVPELSSARLSVQCSDEMDMATACAFACASQGAIQIKTTVSEAISAPLLETIAHTLRLRGDSLGISCKLKTTELHAAMSKLHMITSTKKSATSPFDSGVEQAEDESEQLEKTADITTVGKFARKMGYDISKDDMVKVFEAFGRIANKKGAVGKKELEAIIASTTLQVTPTYVIDSYVINSGNRITPTAHITLIKDEKPLGGFTVGDGPIDAAFLAIEQIVGRHYELDDFQIQAVTEGHGAMGDALVKLRSNGKLYSGKGISTDIIGASIRAYVNALNKIVYEEKN